MPKVTTIKEALDMPADAVVYVFKGTIKKVYKRTSSKDPGKRPNAHGDWSFEDMIVSDGQAEMKVTLKDRDPLGKEWQGKAVYFLSSNGDKGWHGVKTKDDEDGEGKPRRVLWVTPSAQIVPAHEFEKATPPTAAAPPAASSAPAAQTQQATTTAAKPEAKAPTDPSVVKKAIFDARQFAGKRLSLLKIATRAVLKFKQEFEALPPEIRGDIKITDDVFWPRVNSLYMSLEAEGLAIRRGFADDLATNISFVDLAPVAAPPKAAASAPQPATPPAQPPPPPTPPPPPKPKICPKCNVHELDANGLCEHCDDDVPF